MTIIYDVFTALSNMNGQSIGRQATELAKEPTDSFNRGADNAAIITLASINKVPSFAGVSEKMKKAEADASAMGQETHDGLMKCLIINLYYNEIRDEFDIDD